MIVFDTSTLVGVVLKPGSVPAQAFEEAVRSGRLALSAVTEVEIVTVLGRSKFSALLTVEERASFIEPLRRGADWFDPPTRIADCRDPTDDKFLELALASGAHTIVSSDDDLLVLDPWRSVRILTPAQYLASLAAT